MQDNTENSNPVSNQPVEPRVHQSVNTRVHKKKTVAIIALVLVVITLALSAGAVGAWVFSQMSDNRSHVIPGSNFDGNTVISEEEADMAQIVKEVSPSVVSIVTTQATGSGYFQRIAEGAGTGVIISSARRLCFHDFLHFVQQRRHES